MNTVQLVGTQSGEILVPVYSWNTFLGEHFRKLPGIKKYHHFTLSASKPGVVTLKGYADSPSTTFSLLCDDWTPAADEMPPVISPSGLSAERQRYLFNQIREFCRKIWSAHTRQCHSQESRSNRRTTGKRVGMLHQRQNGRGNADFVASRDTREKSVKQRHSYVIVS